jgi:hypothetical protein
MNFDLGPRPFAFDLDLDFEALGLLCPYEKLKPLGLVRRPGPTKKFTGTGPKKKFRRHRDRDQKPLPRVGSGTKKLGPAHPHVGDIDFGFGLLGLCLSSKLKHLEWFELSLFLTSVNSLLSKLGIYRVRSYFVVLHFLSTLQLFCSSTSSIFVS